MARTQVLLATILPSIHTAQAPAGTPLSATASKETSVGGDKLASLLPLGVPSVDSTFQPALDLATGASRFGLLLVGPALVTV